MDAGMSDGEEVMRLGAPRRDFVRFTGRFEIGLSDGSRLVYHLNDAPRRSLWRLMLTARRLRRAGDGLVSIGVRDFAARKMPDGHTEAVIGESE